MKERKTDRRTLYTRKMIMDAYIQLLKENKSKEKIKITELCKIAEINRCTFYLHFKDVPDVETAIIEQISDRLREFSSQQSASTTNRLSMSDLFQNNLMHDEAFRTLFASHAPSGILSILIESFYSDLLSVLPKDNHLTDREKQLLYLFIVGGVNAVEQDWIQNDRDIKEENHFLDAMVQALIHIRSV